MHCVERGCISCMRACVRVSVRACRIVCVWPCSCGSIELMEPTGCYMFLSCMVLVGESNKEPYTALVVQVARGTVQKGFDEKSITQGADDDAGSSDSSAAADGSKSKDKRKKKNKDSVQPKIPRHLRVPRYIAVPMHVNFVSRVVVARLSEYRNGAHTRS